MLNSSKAVLLLTGGLLICGKDWSLAEFGGLFRRLESEIDNSASLRRYVRYFGETGKKIEIRFFGISVDSIKTIPEGMVSLELSDEGITVYRQERGNPAISWQRPIAWDWLDRSNPEFPTGEFITSVPPDWLSVSRDFEIRFILSANSYSQEGIVPDDDVHLVDYDPSWPDRFEEVANWLRNSISPDIALRIKHYGSTAIPGIPAKPVIDILLEVPSFSEARRNLIPLFNKPECEYWWYDEHMVFIVRDESTGLRTFHIHVAPRGHRVWEGLTFRDYLRTHPEDVQRYADLKYKLAESHSNDREVYTDLKTNFVREIIIKASKHD
ncbi:MAG TPA: GrpB family protein [Dehalococcoidia bacterium]|nr:GrpB family protein [Dehalococcoidia bacterium]